MRITAITRYPVKSCRGQALDSALVEPWGLAGDRRWMVVDDAGDQITAREVHRMVLVDAEPVDGALRLAAPDLPPLTVPVPSGGDTVPVRVWDSPVRALPAGEAADTWFGKAIGTPARLVYLDDPAQRPTDQRYTHPADVVSLADGYPLLLTTEASLAALNQLISQGPRAEEGPLPMARFRPNLVVDGELPWAEDDWRVISVGGARLRAVKGCDRCVFTTIDPDTGVSGKEPITTLARHRRYDGKTWFGINLVPDTPGVRVGVGDEVAVVSAVGPGEGPRR